MKKNLLALLLSTCFLGSQAQSLQVITVEADTLAVGNAYTTADIASYINIENVGPNSIDVLVKRIDKNINALIDSNAICWQICFETDVSVSPPIYAITLDPGDRTTTSDFIGHVYPDKDGIARSGEITYVFFDMNNPNDSVAHTVKYEVNATFNTDELEQKTRLSVYPNPASSNLTLDFDLEGLSAPSFELVNLVGNVVYRRNLPANFGQVDLNISKLSRGVYFYVLRDGGDSLLTKKIIVQ